MEQPTTNQQESNMSSTVVTIAWTVDSELGAATYGPYIDKIEAEAAVPGIFEHMGLDHEEAEAYIEAGQMIVNVAALVK